MTKQLTFFNLVTVVRPDDSLCPGNGPGLALDVDVVPGHPPLLWTALDLWGSGHLDLGGVGGDGGVTLDLGVAEVGPDAVPSHQHRQVLLLTNNLKHTFVFP